MIDLKADDIKVLYNRVPLNSYTAQPWWVVVINPRRQQMRPKFYKAFADNKSAEDAAKEQQKRADEQAKTETEIRKKDWPAFRYLVIERPK